MGIFCSKFYYVFALFKLYKYKKLEIMNVNKLFYRLGEALF